MRIKIIGNGVWGKAIYSVVRQNYSDVCILKRNEKTTNQDIVILCVPTQSIRDCLKYVSFSGENRVIINTAKGIEKSTHLLPSQIIYSVFGENIDYYTLIGPSFAGEVVKKMPTLVNLGYKKRYKNIETIKGVFQTDYFRVRLTAGIEILELSAAFKNIYAIACGLAQGLGYGVNTRVELFVLALEEMKSLYENLHLNKDSQITAGTTGDLMLTCNSTESRNFTFGDFLAKYSVNESLDKINSTVEGFHSLNSMEYFKKKAGITLPLATFISTIIKLNNPKKVKKYFDDFIKLT